MIFLDELAPVTSDQWERLVRERIGRQKPQQEEIDSRQAKEHPERRTFDRMKPRPRAPGMRDERAEQAEAEAEVARTEARGRRRKRKR